MADQFITELDAITTFDNTDLVVVEHDPSGTPETNKMTLTSFIDQLLLRFTSYTISRTVASNNLTIAIKDNAGNNATTAKPLYFTIAGVPRKLTASLSVTVNAGAASGSGTFNLGATEFAAKAQDVFVYVGWRASDTSVFLIYSRIPYAHTYADFSATAANEKYGAYSGSAPASTDAVQLIGRVNVQNSGTASYNWSIPSTSIVKNYPIDETEWLSYLPTWSASTPPTIGDGTLVGQYKIRGNECSVRQRTTIGSTTTNGTGTYTWSLPFTAATFTSGNFSGSGRVFDNSTTTTYVSYVNIAGSGSATTMNMTTHSATGAVSGTVPVTLATSDQLYNQTEYAIA